MVSRQDQAPASPAEAYERYYVPALFGPWAAELIERATPGPGERVLDVACGTGIVARLYAPLVGPSGTIVGVDPNPAMLAVARAAAADEGAAIDWREGRADALPVEDAAFDLVCCQQGLQFFQDRAAGLREMRRALAPSGQIALSVWQGLEHHTLAAEFDEAINRHLGVRAFAQSAFSLGDADELRNLLTRAGFRDVTIEPVSRPTRFPDPPRFVRLQVLAASAPIPAFAQLDTAGRDAFVEAVTADMSERMRSFIVDDAVVDVAHWHVALAHD